MEKPDNKRKTDTQAVLEALWLTYYNDTLFARGSITEEIRNRMRVLIKNRSSKQQ